MIMDSNIEIIKYTTYGTCSKLITVAIKNDIERYVVIDARYSEIDWLKENITEPSTKIYTFNDDPTEYYINITDITKDGVEDLLSWSIRYIYENTENIVDFIDELQSGRYYSHHLNTRNNCTKISYEELLTKLEERI